jgi:peptidoglycan/LPS O-acetylase OafA/YrhL
VKTIYFQNLDIIRFFAAIGVVLAHGFEAWKDYFVRFRFSEEKTNEIFSGSFEYFDRFFLNLGIGVELFFFISGFLITYILLIEKERFGRISIWRFIVRRSLRIWPLYFLLLAFGPVFTNWMHYGNPDYLSLLFFYANFEVISSLSWQYPFSHYWSIALEEQFYIFWPPILAFVKKIKLPYVLLGLILLSVFSRIYYFMEREEIYLNLYLNTLCRMDTLLIGGLIAYYYQKKPFQFAIPKPLNILLVIGLLGSFFLFPYNEWLTLSSAIFKKYIYLAVFAVILLDYLFNPRYAKTSTLKGGLQYLGKISYGIYMYHNILVIIVIKEILLNNTIYNPFLYALIYIGAVLVAAIISFELYEKWFLRLKNRFARVETRKF